MTAKATASGTEKATTMTTITTTKEDAGLEADPSPIRALARMGSG
jgi:hypothetical protein